MTGPWDGVSDPVRARAIRRSELARRALAATRDEAASLRVALSRETARADAAEARVAATARLGDDRAREIERLEAMVRDLSDAHRALTRSTLWRALSPLRTVLAWLPASARRRR